MSALKLQYQETAAASLRYEHRGQTFRPEAASELPFRHPSMAFLSLKQPPVMRKTIISDSATTESLDTEWLDLQSLADVDVTSEDPHHPIEHALGVDQSEGWRAGTPGPQTVRLLFHHPIRVTRIDLLFEEHARTRTQEFTLRWSAGDGTWQEIVRQSYTFSPGTYREHESYGVNLTSVRVLTLTLIPDIAGAESVATMARWRVG
jgi:hypothetical protein